MGDQRTVIKSVKTATKHANNNPAHMTYPELDETEEHIIEYSDANFPNNTELNSQLGHIIKLTNANGLSTSFSFKSWKPGRVIRSLLAVKIIVFANLFNNAFT